MKRWCNYFTTNDDLSTSLGGTLTVFSRYRGHRVQYVHEKKYKPTTEKDVTKLGTPACIGQ
jgi:hypothetical protein